MIKYLLIGLLIIVSCSSSTSKTSYFEISKVELKQKLNFISCDELKDPDCSIGENLIIRELYPQGDTLSPSGVHFNSNSEVVFKFCSGQKEVRLQSEKGTVLIGGSQYVINLVSEKKLELIDSTNKVTLKFSIIANTQIAKAKPQQVPESVLYSGLPVSHCD